MKHIFAVSDRPDSPHNCPHAAPYRGHLFRNTGGSVRKRSAITSITYTKCHSISDPIVSFLIDLGYQIVPLGIELTSLASAWFARESTYFERRVKIGFIIRCSCGIDSLQELHIRGHQVIGSNSNHGPCLRVSNCHDHHIIPTNHISDRYQQKCHAGDPMLLLAGSRVSTERPEKGHQNG